jgi:L-ascorbate metabolism protein UlaG (beta-lactamase superfamily)
MTVTYLGHSGFLLETDRALFLFDYYTGKTPMLNAAKPLYVFVSHAHHDHYSQNIWSLQKSHPNVRYVLSDDIPKHSIHAQAKGQILWTGADETHHLTEEMTVWTLLSTDEGVAFIVHHGGQNFFHAGDLNFWSWPGDSKAANDDRHRRFMIEMEKIRGMEFDAAFFPLDPRQEDDCGKGLHIFQETAQAKALFPMHFWGKYGVIDHYKRTHPDESDNIIRITEEGQVFDL